MKNPYKTLKSKLVYSNSYWHVVDNSIIRPDGSNGHYYVVHKSDVALAIPLTDDHKYTYLVGQWRYPINRYSWEFPMGGVDEGETPLQGARREFLEETGMKARTWKKIKAHPYISSGLTTEALHLFIATAPERTPDTGEVEITLKKYSVAHVYRMAKTGAITDALTLTALFYLQDYLKK